MIRLTVGLLALASLPCIAASPRIAVLPFAGAKAGFVREQLLAELCEQVICVPPSDIKGRKGPDWNKVQAQNVDAVVKGTIVKSAGGAQLKLQVMNSEGRTPWKTAIKLDHRGELGPSQDRKVLVALERRLHALKRPDGTEDGGSTPDAVDQAFQSRRDRTVKPAPAPPASPAPASSAPTRLASKATAAEEEAAPIATASHSGRRFEPLPPELLNSTPRI